MKKIRKSQITRELKNIKKELKNTTANIEALERLLDDSQDQAKGFTFCGILITKPDKSEHNDLLLDSFDDDDNGQCEQ